MLPAVYAGHQAVAAVISCCSLERTSLHRQTQKRVVEDMGSLMALPYAPVPGCLWGLSVTRRYATTSHLPYLLHVRDKH